MLMDGFLEINIFDNFTAETIPGISEIAIHCREQKV